MNNLIPILEKAADIVIEKSKAELTEQGHDKASGALFRSFETQIAQNPLGFAAEVLANAYWVSLDEGQDPFDIPITQITVWSLYVQPALNNIQRKGFIQNVRRAIRKQGTPTKGSFRFSKNGRRTDFTTYAIREATPEIERLIEGSDIVEQIIDIAIERAKV